MYFWYTNILTFDVVLPKHIIKFSWVNQWWNSVDRTQGYKILFKLMNQCSFQIFWGVFFMLCMDICLSLLRSCRPEIFVSCRNLSEYKCHQNLVHSSHSCSADCYFCKELRQNSGLSMPNLSLDPDLNFTAETDLSYSSCILPLVDQFQICKKNGWYFKVNINHMSVIVHSAVDFESLSLNLELKNPILKLCPVIRLLLCLSCVWIINLLYSVLEVIIHGFQK